MFCVLHNETTPLIRDVQSGEQEIVTKEFLENNILWL